MALVVEATAQDHHTSGPVPALQAQAAFAALPALSGVGPSGGGGGAFKRGHQLAGLGGAAQFEQIVEFTRFSFTEQRLLAIGAVTAQKMGPALGWQSVDERPQPRKTMSGGGLIAGVHLHVQTQAQGGDPVGVVGVAGASGLLRVIADAGTFLTSIDGLDGDIDVEDPLVIQKPMTGLVEVTPQPVLPLLGTDASQRPAHTILADNQLKSEQARGNVVAAQGREVRVAIVPGEHPQKQGSNHVARAVCAVAAVTKRRVRNQCLEASCRTQVLREKHQCPQGAHRQLRGELRTKTSSGCIHNQHLGGIAWRCLVIRVF